MKTTLLSRFLCILLLSACTPPSNSTPFAEPLEANTLVPVTPTPTPMPEPLPEGRDIIVTSTSDSGPGTLRQALQDAQNYDKITFGPAVFPPNAPVTIFVSSEELPHIRANYLTIDASNAGVILDGSQYDGWAAMQIVSGEGSKVMGLQISHFPGAAIAISGGTTRLIIGGDRNVGTGPFGQGNQFTFNGGGIDICMPGKSDISIVGNLLGTDMSGTADLGNWSYGISIYDSAQDITIGPDNMIAYNLNGIKTASQIGEVITITQNQIFGNDSHQIWVTNLSQELPPPTIFNYDLGAGTMSGSTCPNCTVEIFSDSSDGGESFEGSAEADELGNFIFDKGTSFAGPNLTFTATNPDGNTSPFSVPVSGSGRALLLQRENDFPIVSMVYQSYDEMVDNHIGVWFEAHDRFYDQNFVYSNGFKRMRIGQLGGEGQRWGSIINEETLSPEVDNTISEYADAGVEIVLILAAGSGLPGRAEGIFETEDQIELYLAYVDFVVSHFRGRIDAYEILNEPTHMPYEVYVNVVERTVPVIRAADPDAKIIIAAMNGEWEDGYPGYGEHQRALLCVEYLNSVLQAGVVDQVDGISWHPFYDNIPSDPYYQDYPNIVQGIMDLAAANGFTGEYYADEMLWTTWHDPLENQGPPVSKFLAAKYYLRTIIEHRGLGMNVTVQTFFQVPLMAPIKNVNNIMEGAEPIDLAFSTIAIQPANLRQYAFTYPDGSKLISVWINDIGTEEDQNLESVITIPGVTANSVVAIDPMYGYEQELNFVIVDGNLVIENLRVKDYPILIKLSDTTP